MGAVVRLNKAGLNDLINSIKANAGDTTELEAIMNEIDDDEKNHRPVKRRQTTMQVEVEELTTEERLEAEVGGLFPEGLTMVIMAKCIEMDEKYTLSELKKMCVEAGLSPGGHKKELAAKLIAKGVEYGTGKST